MSKVRPTSSPTAQLSDRVESETRTVWGVPVMATSAEVVAPAK